MRRLSLYFGIIFLLDRGADFQLIFMLASTCKWLSLSFYLYFWLYSAWEADMPIMCTMERDFSRTPNSELSHNLNIRQHPNFRKYGCNPSKLNECIQFLCHCPTGSLRCSKVIRRLCPQFWRTSRAFLSTASPHSEIRYPNLILFTWGKTNCWETHRLHEADYQHQRIQRQPTDERGTCITMISSDDTSLNTVIRNHTYLKWLKRLNNTRVTTLVQFSISYLLYEIIDYSSTY